MSWKFNALTPNAYRMAGVSSLAILAGLFIKSCLTDPDYTLLTPFLIVGVPFSLAWLREHYVTRKFQLAIVGAKNYDARSRLLGTTEIVRGLESGADEQSLNKNVSARHIDQMREVRLELCYHLFNYMVTKGIAPTYAAVFTEEYVNGTPIQVCSSSYVTLRDKVHQRDERYKSWYEYCAFLGAENPYLTGQTEIGDIYWDYVVDRSGKIDLTRFTN